MTTDEVLDRHMSHMLSGDLDAILTDYAADAVTADPDGIGRGHDHIRGCYERVLPRFSALELSTAVSICGEVVYLTYRAQRDGRDELLGTDTFVIRDDLIQVHTFYGHAPGSPAAAR